jgi:hypothetical protein
MTVSGHQQQAAPRPGSGDAAAQASPDLGFSVALAEPVPFAAVPTLMFRVAITRNGGGPVQSVNLTTGIRIAAPRRRYDTVPTSAMAELFGAPEQWGTTLRPLAWTQTTTVVPPFDDSTSIDLAVPCSTDAELAITKYFHAVREGDVPLDFLFSGTIFHTGPDGGLRTAQISWAKDATYQLSAQLWHGLIDRYYGGSTWLRLSKDAHDRLSAYRAQQVLPGWDETVHSLLDRAEPPIPHETAGAPWTP